MQAHVLDEGAIQHDAACGGIVIAQQQPKHRAFTRAAGANQGHSLARFNTQAELVQCSLRWP